MVLGRDVRWERSFEDEAAALQPDVRRLDEARRYIERIVCLHPEQGLPTEYPGVRVVPIVLPVGGSLVPLEASVFYTYDDECVSVLSIKPTPGTTSDDA